MPSNPEREDLRIRKTHISLMKSMSNLLRSRNFNQITVNDLCEEALMSRSTFYSHFKDKYDLLKYWLSEAKSTCVGVGNTYEDLEKIVNDFADNNRKSIKNLVEDANCETSALLCDFFLSMFNINIDRVAQGPSGENSAVLESVCCGGMLNYLSWHVNNKFPADLPVMNPVIYDVLLSYQKWSKKQNASISKSAHKSPAAGK